MNDLDGVIEMETRTQLELEIIKLGKVIMFSLAVIAVCVFGTIAVKAYVGFQSAQVCI
ncbi:MAG TPA: hypothetical protein VFV43_09060 [Limnobacter sp.]|nr:hypothetical protein [Limnobacter sp.]